MQEVPSLASRVLVDIFLLRIVDRHKRFYRLDDTLGISG
jgi:hypothetical protein